MNVKICHAESPGPLARFQLTDARAGIAEPAPAGCPAIDARVGDPAMTETSHRDGRIARAPTDIIADRLTRTPRPAPPSSVARSGRRSGRPRNRPPTRVIPPPLNSAARTPRPNSRAADGSRGSASDGAPRVMCASCSAQPVLVREQAHGEQGRMPHPPSQGRPRHEPPAAVIPDTAVAHPIGQSPPARRSTPPEPMTTPTSRNARGALHLAPRPPVALGRDDRGRRRRATVRTPLPQSQRHG